MSSLGATANYQAVTVQNANCNALVLAQSGAPPITTLFQGQKYVSSNSLNNHDLILLSGKEIGQPGRPNPVDVHYDGWVPSSCLSSLPSDV